MSAETAPQLCPDCGGEMYDNRSDKLKPTSPDFRCKDQECGKAVWLSKGRGKKGGGAVAGAIAPPPAAAAPPQHRTPNTRIVLERYMQHSLRCARVIVSEQFDKELAKTPEGLDLVVRIANAIFIARLDGKGIFAREKPERPAAAPAPPPPPPPPPPPQPEQPAWQALDDEADKDDDLPF